MTREPSHSRFDPVGIPDELKAFPQWVAWRFGDVRPNGKSSKPPINPHTGREAKVSSPKSWGTFEQAVECCERLQLEGVGIMLTKETRLPCVDLDGGYDPETGELT